MAKKDFPFVDFDIAKMMGDFQFPGVDMTAMLDAQRKNIEALTEANRRAAEGMQALGQRQAEILQQTMAELSETMSGVMAGQTPEVDASKQAELAKEAFDRALGYMRELAEMASKANTEAFEVVNSRLQEQMQELKGLMPGPGASQKK